MRYKHDTLLPIGAFKRQGSVVGGRSIRLHGGDSWYAQPEEPRYEEQIADFYWTVLGRAPDQAGLNYWVSEAERGASLEGILNTLKASPEAQKRNAPPPAPTPAPTPPPTPAAPAYKPFNLDEFGGLGGSDEQNGYYNAAKLANRAMENGRPDLAQQFIDRANELKAHLSQPYRIDTLTSGAGGDAGTSTESVLVMPGGGYVPVVQDEQGQYVAKIIGSGSGESGGSNTTGAAVNPQEIAEQEAQAKIKPYGTGMGPALGYAYGMNNSEGNLYRKFDAQGNLTEFLDEAGVFQPASIFKPVGTQFNAETGKLDTVYETPVGTTRVEGPSFQPNKYHDDQGGWLGEGGWGNIAGLVAVALTANPALFGAIGVPATLGKAIVAGAASVAKGMSNGENFGDALKGALKTGAITAVTAGALDSLSSMDVGSIVDSSDAGSIVSGGIGDAGASMSYTELLKAAGITDGAPSFTDAIGKIKDIADVAEIKKDLTSDTDTKSASDAQIVADAKVAADKVAADKVAADKAAADAKNNEITKAYKDILGREPDAAGLKYWAESGQDINTIRSNIQANKNQEITKAYKDILGREPDAAGLKYWSESGNSIDDIRKNIALVKQQEINKADNAAATALVSDLDKKVAANEAAGMTRDEATNKAIKDLAASTGKSDDEIKKLVADNQTATTKLVSDLDTKIAANEAAGMTRDAATDKAIKDLATSTGKSDEEIKKLVTDNQAAATKLVSDLDAKVAANEAAGMTRDQATQKAISDLAASTGKTDAEIKALIASNQSDTAKLVSDLDAKIAANEKAGMTRDAATDKAITDLATSLGTTEQDLKDSIAASQAGLEKNIAGVKTDLTKLITDNEAAGLSRSEATDKAIKDLAASLGTTEQELKDSIASSQASLEETIGGVKKDLTGDITNVKTDLTKLIEANEKAGMTRSKATDKAIKDLSGSLGTTEQALKDAIATSQAGLEKNIEGVKTDLTKLITDNEAAGLTRSEASDKAIKDLAASLGTTEQALKDSIAASQAGLEEAIGGVKTDLSSNIEGVKTDLTKLIEANEKAGMTRSEATDKAVSDLAESLGTTEKALKDSIASSQTGLEKNIEGVKTDLTKLITDNEAAGLTRSEASDKAIKDLAASLGTTEQALKDSIAASQASLEETIGGVKTGLAENIGKVKTDLETQIAANETAGMTRSEATNKAITDLATSLGTTEQALKDAITASQTGLETTIGDVKTGLSTDIAGVKSDLTKLITDNEAAGLTRSEASDKAIKDLATSLGTTEQALLDAIGSSKSGLESLIGDVKTGLETSIGGVKTGLETTIGGVKSELEKLITDNEAAGLTRSEATDKAIADLASSLGTTEQALLDSIAGTKSDLTQQITDVETGLGGKITDLGKDLATGLEGVKTDIAGVETTLLDQIAKNELAGMTREQALQAAITGVSTQLGTTEKNLLDELGLTKADLGSQISNVETNLGGRLDKTEQDLLDAIGATETTLGGQIGGVGQQVTDLTKGFTDFTDYTKKQDEENRRRKQGEEAMGLLSQMASGSVKSGIPAEIDYFYDIGGESLFATPKQESLLPSPYETQPEAVEGAQPRYQYYDPSGGYLYAGGGMVEDEYTIDDLYRMLGSE